MTPIVVAFVSELLHRPTEKIAGRFTSESTAIDAGTAGAEPAPKAEERLPKRPPAEPGSELQPSAPGRPDAPRPVRVNRRIALGVVAATGALAFVIAAAVLTVPELLAGGSIAGGDRPTIIGGGKKTDVAEQQPAETQPRTTERPAPATDPPKQPKQKKPLREKEPARTAPQPGKAQPTPTPTTPSPPPPKQLIPGIPLP